MVIHYLHIINSSLRRKKIMDSCNNGFTSEEEYFAEFGKDDVTIDKCSTCGHFSYTNGIATCDKFQTNEDVKA